MSSKLTKAIRRVNRGMIRYGSMSALALASGLVWAEEEAVAVESQAVEQQANDEDIEEVTVVGIRQSIKNSQDIKRYSRAVVEAISAEDVGKFPDKNVAESLARIPGVAISRDFGEGQAVSIRGLPAEYNLTQVNGQAVGTAQWYVLSDATRNFNYEMLSPELISKVEVFKSAQADIDEGGIGGNVILHTRKPLEMEANTAQLNVEMQHSDLPEETDPSFSGLYSWKSADEKFGTLIAYSKQNRTTRREATELFTPTYFSQFDRDWNASENPGTPFNAPTGAAEQGMIPWGVGSALFEQDRERTGIDANLQWAPTDQFNANLHVFVTELKASNSNSNFIGIPFRGVFAANNVSTGQVENGIITELNVDGGDPAGWANHVAFDNIYRDGSKMDTNIIDLDMEYTGDTFSVHGQLGQTFAKGVNNDFFTEFFADSADARINFDYTNPGGEAPAISYARSPWVANPTDEMTLTGVFDQENTTDDIETYAQADAFVDVELGDIDQLKFGVKLRDRSFEQSRKKTEMQNAAVGAGQQSLGNVGDFVNGTFTVDHSNTSMPSSTFMYPNQGAMNSAFYDLPICVDGGTDLCRTAFATVNESSYKIEEKINSLYAMANFEGDFYRGNFGVRYVMTDTDSTGWDTDNNQPISQDSSYTNILPSLNLIVDIADDLQGRFAAGSGLARPAPFALSSAVNLTPETSSGVAGNPELKATKSTNMELGVEWYPEDASMVSATLYKMSISDWVLPTTRSATIDGTFIQSLSTFENGADSEVNGFELSVQYALPYGFGVGANYANNDVEEIKHTAQDGTTSTVQIPRVSENVINSSVYWENQQFSARLNYNYRTEFFLANQESGARYGDDQVQWDAQLSYAPMENLTLRAEFLNITDEIIEEFYRAQNGTEVRGTQLYNGRRFFLGASYKF